MPAPGSHNYFGAAFPSHYFCAWPAVPGTTQSTTGPVDAARTPSRDREILKLIREAIDATGTFDAVYTTGPEEDQGFSSELYRICYLELTGFDEADMWNDEGPVILRTVRFACTIAGRDGDPDERDDLTDRLYNAAANAVNGRSIGQITFVDKTNLKKGRYSKASPPERQLTCEGQFAYDVPGWAAHDDQS